MERSIRGGDPQTPDLTKALEGKEKIEELRFIEVVHGYMPSDNELKILSNATVYFHKKSNKKYLFWDDSKDLATNFVLEIMSSKEFDKYKDSNRMEGRKMWTFGSQVIDRIQKHSFNNIDDNENLQQVAVTNKGFTVKNKFTY